MATFGPASRSLAATPRTTSQVPTGKIGSFMVALRDKFIDSAALLAWRQDVESSQTTSGAVILGRRPQDNTQVSKDDGPFVYIRRGGLRSINAGMEDAFTHELRILADIVWFEDRLVSNIGISEVDPLDDLLDELEDVGNALASGFGGQFLGIDMDETDEYDEVFPDVHHAEMQFIIWYGSE